MDELLWCRLQMSVVTHVRSRWIQSPVMTVPTSPPLLLSNLMLTSKCSFWLWWWETIIQRVELADLADILLLKELATWTNPIRHLKTYLKWERRQCPGLEEIEGFLRNRKQTPPPLPHTNSTDTMVTQLPNHQSELKIHIIMGGTTAYLELKDRR